MTDYKDFLKETNLTMGKVGKALPEAMRGFVQLHDKALEDKVLDMKTKELIAMGISIAVRCEPCIISHMTALIELGVTREELAEVVGVAVFMGGGPSIAYGGKALEAFDQLTK